MGRIAFVFSGQGDQYPGMGKELYEKYPIAASVFQMCDSLRPGTMQQCFEGTAEELKETKNTQPCLFAMELAAAEVLLEKGIMPNVVAGFSLGEVVAAAVAGCFDHETGFRLASLSMFAFRYSISFASFPFTAARQHFFKFIVAYFIPSFRFEILALGLSKFALMPAKMPLPIGSGKLFLREDRKSFFLFLFFF